MGLFKRSSSVSSVSSSNSTTGASSITSASSVASSKNKVKPGELNFANTASPNSRILALGPEPQSLTAPGSPHTAGSVRSSKESRVNGGGGKGAVAAAAGGGGAVGAAAASRPAAPPALATSESEEESEESEEEEDTEEEDNRRPTSKAKSSSSPPSSSAANTTSAPTPPQPKRQLSNGPTKSAGIAAAAGAGAAAAMAAVRPSAARANSQKSVASNKSNKSTNGGGAMRGARSDSPSGIEDEEEDSEEYSDDYSESEESEEELEPTPVARQSAAVPQKGAKKGQRSKAARLAAEAMDSPITTKLNKSDKPLASLTLSDVALDDKQLRNDIQVIWKAMHLFMNSRMIEAEDICLSSQGLYFSVGYALIQCIKSLATFEPDDLEAAIQCCKDAIMITQLLRKKDHSVIENVGRLAKGSTSVGSIKAMTTVQRHAELIYAECTLLKAVLGIIYSGDFVAFLKEALNMRNAYSIYRTLAKYVETVDQEYGGGEDPSIDNDFRSGVFLGNGLISLILSLLPSAVLKIMTVFGFTGDREYALRTLMKGGKWQAGVKEPGMPVEQEGIRRQICDMVLLTHHLVIASYLPVGGVDVPTAANVLHYNLDRYPNGIFFLYFAGRLHSTETELDKAIKAFHLAIQAQREYIQLGHICYWDLGLVSLAKGDYNKGYECFNILDKESNWSKAIYAYAKATTLYEEGKDVRKANEIMKNVPDLMQRIAGKSIPLEKFVARRARKFVAQGNRLTLPGIELAYVLNCLGLSPRFVLFDIHLDQVSAALAELHKVKDPKNYGNGSEFWDDYCLAHLLRGIILRFIAHPESHTVPNPSKSQIPVKEADEQAMISFNNILKHGREISQEHHLVWFAHYELGRLYDSKGESFKAREQYELVMGGKNLEISNKKGKGKVSLQNMAVLRSNAALNLLRDNKKI